MLFTFYHQLKLHILLAMLLSTSILKICFISCMLLLNLWYIMKPCIFKYLDEGVMIEVSNKPSGSLQSPAITVSRIGPDGM